LVKENLMTLYTIYCRCFCLSMLYSGSGKNGTGKIGTEKITQVKIAQVIMALMKK